MFIVEARMNEAKFDRYKTSLQFNEAERAALDYTAELRRYKKVAPETFKRLEEQAGTSTT
jgi:hypothetical protein